jgi:pyruvate dehydrogenase E2 component (dihydrolipoamide acetyltransferase)
MLPPAWSAMSEFRMPSLGAEMEAGTLVQWLKRPGDALHRGDIIAVVDTEKGAIEIEVFEDGVLAEIRVQPGEKVPVGTVLALIDGATPRPALAPEPTPPAPAAPSRASPAARALAAEMHLDLSSVTGTGPDGVITRADVERAASRVAPAGPPTAAEATARMRQAIAAAMTRAKREIPHFYLGTTIDMTPALTWLASENARRPVADRLLPAALLLKSVALAVLDVPGLNGFWADGAYRAGTGIHLGVAVSLRDGGLVAPAIHDADRKELTAIMAALRDLVARARAGGLKSSELSDPTITITNLGEQGVEVGYGIIYPPQVALVSFGKIMERPMAIGGKVEVRSVLTATISADHRAVDGHRAGRFLSALDSHLQQPEGL